MSLFQIHCYTTRIARRLATTEAALPVLRAPLTHRSEAAIELRKAVADAVKVERRLEVRPDFRPPAHNLTQ